MTRFAPEACSGRRFPWVHVRAIVGPLSASEGISTFFLRNHWVNLGANKEKDYLAKGLNGNFASVPAYTWNRAK